MAETPQARTGTLAHEQLLGYLAARDQQRVDRFDRLMGSLSERERRLVREAAVMGYVQGTLAPAGAPIPPDSETAFRVVSSALDFPEQYPVLHWLDGEAAAAAARPEQECSSPHTETT